ncbi:MAG: phosphatidylglycerophosphatase A [Opitutaceae bacterium]
MLSTRVVVAGATLAGLGRKMPAPGTWGSLAGLLYFAIFFYRLDVITTLIASAVGGYLAVAFCGEAEKRLAKQDPGEVILDEFVAMPLCFLGWQSIDHRLPPWAVLLAGFTLFRFYDIAKPLGISRLQALPGGWGVVADDMAAALAACATLHLSVWIWRIW